ncbi:DUF551 domain-containing protein [Escherichia coli]|nr:DUF551 domain-containing protein [Escherichia coli]KAE9769395.1 DUF551 domain-containing protein [Escherichia coli]MWL80728.1 DUF551 domain-containing protein [Escherichia coli]
MSTITKERIELFIKSPLENGLTRGEQMELARIALASLEAEPIGAFHIAEQQVDGTSDYIKDGEWPIDNGIIEVYAAPPIPVVPEEKPMPNPLKMYAVDAVAAIAEVRGWNACRAAMLQGKSEQPQNAQQNIPENIPGGNSPVTPDGWISCSERMPEETGDIIVVSDGIVMSGISYSRRDGFYIAALEYDDDEPIGGVTHWMPLPEPPRLKEL